MEEEEEDPANPSCSVCGNLKQVGNPEAIFEFPGYDPIGCSELELAGVNGDIPPDTCVVLPYLIGVCGCIDQQEEDPMEEEEEEDPANPSCSVCGNLKQVGNPEAIFEF